MENKPRKWWIAGLLTFVITGLGQLYNGELKKAVIFYGVSLLLSLGFIACLYNQYVGIYFVAFIVLIILSIAFTIFVLIDAVKTARKFSEEYRLKKYNRASIYLVIILAVFTISLVGELFNIHCSPKAYTTPSTTMEPTLLVGDRIFVDQSIFRKNPQRGDVIIFEYPQDSSKSFIKRVVAVGDDTVEIRNKQLFVNDALVNENYIIHTDNLTYPSSVQPRDNFGPVTITADSYFVMGDNRDASMDSRYFGYIPKAKVIGIARLIYWSWDSDKKAVRWNRIGTKVQ